VKAGYAFAIRGRQAISVVDTEQPKLIECGAIERAQKRITFNADSISRRHRKKRIATFIDLRLEKGMQRGEATYVPIIDAFGNRRLQQNA